MTNHNSIQEQHAIDQKIGERHDRCINERKCTPRGHSSVHCQKHCWCAQSKNTCRFVHDEIMSTKPREAIVKSICDCLGAVAKRIRNRELPLEQFVITEKLSKHQYDELIGNHFSHHHHHRRHAPPQVQAAKWMLDNNQKIHIGEHIPYVTTSVFLGGKNISDYRGIKESAELDLEAHHPKDIENNSDVSSLSPDIEWYLTYQIFYPVSYLCEPIEGISNEIIAEKLGLSIIDSKNRRHTINRADDHTKEQQPTPLFKVGEPVILRNLVNQPSLNGSNGVIAKELDASTQRYTVHLSMDSTTSETPSPKAIPVAIVVKAANLERKDNVHTTTVVPRLSSSRSSTMATRKHKEQTEKVKPKNLEPEMIIAPAASEAASCYKPTRTTVTPTTHTILHATEPNSQSGSVTKTYVMPAPTTSAQTTDVHPLSSSMAFTKHNDRTQQTKPKSFEPEIIIAPTAAEATSRSKPTTTTHTPTTYAIPHDKSSRAATASNSLPVSGSVTKTYVIPAPTPAPTKSKPKIGSVTTTVTTVPPLHPVATKGSSHVRYGRGTSRTKSPGFHDGYAPGKPTGTYVGDVD